MSGVATQTTALLVAAAADGEETAWDALVEQYCRLVWSVVRDHGLSDADAADVSQTTWLRLAEHLHRLRDPERVGLWLATTARNEALRLRRRAQREHLAEPSSPQLESAEVRAAARDVDTGLLEEERNAALWRAFEALPAGCKSLLRTLIADPSPSYAEVSAQLGMPVGSIGPRRNRCLDQLRRRSKLDLPGSRGVHSPPARRAVG